jgi:hypothetical protein
LDSLAAASASTPDDALDPGTHLRADGRSYANSPVATRWPKDVSGNPAGRPKGTKGLRAIVRQVLRQQVTVNTPAGRKKITKLRALIEVWVNKAIEKDARAFARVLELVKLAGLNLEAELAEASKPLTAAEQRILGEWLGLISRVLPADPLAKPE